jgi:ABC-type dipeptide/oligopeptide/nickel transport system permease component
VKIKLIDHALSILFVTLVFAVVLLFGLNSNTADQREYDVLVESLVKQHTIDLGNPLHKAVFKDALNLFYPDHLARNDSLLQSIDSYRMEQFTNQVYKTGSTPKRLTFSTLLDIAGMFVNFILIYLVVMAISYYAAHTVAIYSFVKRKQRISSYTDMLFMATRPPAGDTQNQYFLLRIVGKNVVLALQVLLKGFVYLILFSPSYIIAYSMKSTFETGGYVFMIVLGVISNGLLINYAYKFYTILLNESRKGYVQNAIVKGLDNSYEWNTPDGISFLSILKLKKSFPSHVFQHIYANARYQYIPTMKQHASFLITGLIIIEMALNIQGHLCYELLQDILYRYYDIALVIIFGVFLMVKATEMLVDFWFYYESQKYENKL